MGVKVVETKPDPSVVKHIICKNCGAKLEYVPNDVKTKHYTCMGEPSGSEYVKCPNCGKDATVREW